MYTRWTQHLSDAEEKEKFKNEIYGAKRVLERLRDIIQEDEKALSRSEIDSRIYTTPSWDYLQAHKNGNRQYMNTMINMVDLDLQKGSQ